MAAPGCAREDSFYTKRFFVARELVVVALTPPLTNRVPRYKYFFMATSKTTDDIRQVMIETARVQFASLNAGIVFWSGWLQSASRFAQTLNTELSNLGKEGTDKDAMLSKITD